MKAYIILLSKNSLILSLQSSLNSLTLKSAPLCNCAFSPIPLLKCSQTYSPGVSQITQECILISFFFLCFSLCLEFFTPIPLPQLKEVGMIQAQKIFKNIIFKNLFQWFIVNTHSNCCMTHTLEQLIAIATNRPQNFRSLAQLATFIIIIFFNFITQSSKLVFSDISGIGSMGQVWMWLTSFPFSFHQREQSCIA